MTADDALRDALVEATAAFDASNHAWGRFFLYVLRPYRGGPPAPDPAPVRAAFQEAALLVPHSTDLEEVSAFAAAIVDTRRAVEAFTAALPAALRTGDVLLVPDALGEALEWLQPFQDSGLRSE